MLANISAIKTGCNKGLEGLSMDADLLFDTFHGMSDPDGVLLEIHCVLEMNCILPFSDHYMEDGEILPRVTGMGLTWRDRKGRRSYIFLRQG